ncbi:MAG: peptide ABC transporter substrate-binding protein [Chloroflexi bacterium]|nr:peptide ABC transporter substrate-binding protein [Chloroflexota bacterium]MDA1271187.1 peptide ABC transporter substrate-binding protein [Chloroflexota bacterium]
MGWKPLLLVLGVLLLAAGCSGSSGSNGAEATRSPEATAAPSVSGSSDPAVSDGSPLEGGRFVRLFVDPPTLDPHLTTDATSAQIIVEVFGGLVTIDKDLNVVADLAENWEVTGDGRIYTFRIRPDAKFHDGKPVTAEDVRWSLERATDPLTEAPNADQYLGDIVGVDEKLSGDALEISGVRVVDERTIEITIDQPKSYFLAKLTYPTAFVLDRVTVEANPKTWFRKPNGTGPFRLSEYKVGETLVLTRNENYHLGPPKLAEVEMILSGGTSMLMYENDEIDIAGVGLADLDRLLDTSHSLNSQLMRAAPSFSVQYIGLNVNEPPLDDVKVRQALNLSIDKREIATIVLGDQVVPAKGILPPGFPGFNPSVTGYSFDPDRARQLLSESKYGGDLDNLPPITITTPGSFGANVSLDMEVVLSMWEQNLGIKTEFQQTEFATFLKDLNKRRFQMFDIGWIADYPDPENFLDILFYSDSSNNHTNYSNPEVDSLLEDARVETDEFRRYAIYNQVEQMILDDAPWIPLWYSGERYLLVKPNVRDYLQTPLIIPKLRYVYLTNQ